MALPSQAMVYQSLTVFACSRHTGETNTLRLVSEAIAGTGGFYSKTITRDHEGSGMGQVPGRDAGFHIGSDYEVNYYYDNADSGGQLTGTGRFKRITGPGLPTYGVQYSYTANGDLLAGWKFKTGSDDSTTVAWVSRGYDPNRDLLTSVSNSTIGSPGTFSTYTYGYDQLGRRKSVVYTGAAFAQNHLFKWGYNPRSELTTADRHQGTNPDAPGDQYTQYGDYEFAYDHIGNRQTYGLDANPDTAYTANDLNQYDSTTNPAEAFDYDDDGNLKVDKQFLYTWDAENRLIEAVTRIEAGQNPSASAVP